MRISPYLPAFIFLRHPAEELGDRFWVGSATWDCSRSSPPDSMEWSPCLYRFSMAGRAAHSISSFLKWHRPDTLLWNASISPLTQTIRREPT